MWNELIKIYNDQTQTRETRLKAYTYLGQLNTAAGKEMIGDEIKSFLNKTKNEKK